MSSSIEYRRAAFSINVSEEARQLIPYIAQPHYFTRNDSLFLVFVETGDSNSFDYSGRRSRSWYLQFAGNEHLTISQVLEMLPSVHGHMLWPMGGRGKCSPENYVKIYRKVLREAQSDADTRRLLGGMAIQWHSPTLDLG